MIHSVTRTPCVFTHQNNNKKIIKVNKFGMNLPT